MNTFVYPEYDDTGLRINYMQVEMDQLYKKYIESYKHYIKYRPITKKMKSKSKQSRYVRVVMKGGWE